MSLYPYEKQDVIQQKWLAYKDARYNDVVLEFGMPLPRSRGELSRRCEIRTYQLDPTRETLVIDGNPVLEVAMKFDPFKNAVVFKSTRIDK